MQGTLWTLYKYGGDNSNVMEQAEKLRELGMPFAITMPIRRAKTGLPSALGRLSIPTYTHTVNSPKEFNEMRDKYGIDEIYTDILAPETHEN